MTASARTHNKAVSEMGLGPRKTLQGKTCVAKPRAEGTLESDSQRLAESAIRTNKRLRYTLRLIMADNVELLVDTRLNV